MIYCNLISFCIPIQNDWGNWSDFLIMITSLINLLIFAYLTCQIHKYNIAKDDRNDVQFYRTE